MKRIGVDAIWYMLRPGYYEADDGRTLEKEGDNMWWGNSVRGGAEAVFKTLTEGLRMIWK